MLSFIKKFFRCKKIKSIDDFIKRIKTEGDCNTVKVIPYLSVNANEDDISILSASFSSVGIIANFTYMLKYLTISKNEEIIYEESIFSRYRSEFGLSDKTERRDASKKFFLLGGQKVKELQAKLPTNIEVFFVGMDNSPINSRTFST